MKVKFAQSCPTLCHLVGYTIHGILQARILERVDFLRDLPNPGIKLRSPTLQVDSLPTEPPGKPNNTRVGSLSFLWGNLPDTGIEPGSPASQADSLPVELSGKPFKERLMPVLKLCQKTNKWMKRKEYAKIHFMRLTLPWYQSQIRILKKKKITGQYLHEFRPKKIQQY